MLPGLSQAKYFQVIALGAAAGEDNFRCAASEQRGYRLACALHRCPRLLSMVMDGRRVPEALAEVVLHGLKDRRQDGCGGVVVEIDAAHRHSAILRRICEDGNAGNTIQGIK